MKQYYCIILLLFSFSFYAQNDTIPVVKKTNISVVSADKMNVVYRGVLNPISIAVNNAKSYTVSGDGVSLQNGKYVLRAGAGKETKVIVKIENFDGSKIIEEHIFRIKDLPKGLGTINGYNCDKCIVELTKEELLNAEISAKIPEFLFDYNVEIKSFNVKFFDKTSSIEVVGNKFNEEVKNRIKKSKNGTYLLISNIKKHYSCDNCNEFARSIKVLISE
jgi:hypothetical protein